MGDRMTVDISEAAKMLGVSRAFMYKNMLNRSDFPIIRLGGKCLIPTSELKAWISAQLEASHA